MSDQAPDVSAYDAACLLGAEDNKWADSEEAAKLGQELFDDWGTDQDKWEAGTKWSHLYAANSILFLFVVFTTLFTYWPGLSCIKFRLGCQAVCWPILCLYSFCMIIVTPVYRFSTAGKLCALN